MKKLPILCLALAAALLLAACGASAEQSAAEDQSATGDTPAPTATNTPTATPAPIDLALRILGEDGQPLANASVVMIDGDESQVTGESGELSWEALPAAGVAFSVSAQGYLTTVVEPVLRNGLNLVSINLPRDPYGLLASEACLPGETLLYMQDFQNANAETGWDNIDARQEGWEIIQSPDAAGNMAAANTDTDIHGFTSLTDASYHDAAFRIWYYITDGASLSFNWLQGFEPYENADGETVEDVRYQMIFDSVFAHHVQIRHLEQPVRNFPLTSRSLVPAAGEWHFVEASTLDDVVQVWVDGQRIAYYTDPNPLPENGVSLEVPPNPNEDTIVYFDNISICGMTEEFQSMYVADEAGDS